MACGAPAAVELLYGPGEAGSSERLQLGSAVNVAGRALLCSVESAEQLRKRLEDQREALAKRSRPGSSPEPRTHNVSTQDEGAQRNGPSAETVEGEDPLVQRVVGQVECNATQEHRPHGQQLDENHSAPREATPSEDGAASEASGEGNIVGLFIPQLQATLAKHDPAQATPARAAKRKHSASPAPLPWRAPSRQCVAPSLAERLQEIAGELHEVKEGRRTSEANFIVKKALRAVLDVLPGEAWAMPLVDLRTFRAQRVVNPGGAVEQVKQTGDLENSELRDLQELLAGHGFNEPRDAAPFLESIESKLRADAFKRGWLTREPDYVHTKRFIWREQLIAGFPDWAGAAESALAVVEALDADGSLSAIGKLGFSLAGTHCRLGRKSWAERFARVWRRIRWIWCQIPCSACRPGIGPRSREWAARIERARDECDIEALKRGILWVLDEALRPGARVRKRIPSEMEGRKPKVPPSELKPLQKWTQAEEQEWRRNLRECRGPIRLGNLVWQLYTQHMDYQDLEPFDDSDDDINDDAARRASCGQVPARPGSGAPARRTADRSGPGGPSSGAAARMGSEDVVDDRSARAEGGGTGVDVPRVKTEPEATHDVRGSPAEQGLRWSEHVGALNGRCGVASAAASPRGAVAGLLAARGLLKRGSVSPAGQEASGRKNEGPSEVEQSGRADAAALGAPKMRARKLNLGPWDEQPKVATARKSAAAPIDAVMQEDIAPETRAPHAGQKALNQKEKPRKQSCVVELWPPGHASDGEPCMSPQEDLSADVPDTASDDSAHILTSDEDPCDALISMLIPQIRERAVPSATFTWQANITCTALPKEAGFEYYIPFKVDLEDVQSDADDERESGPGVDAVGGVATAVAAPAAAVNVLPFQPGKLAALPASVSANTVHSDDTVMQCAAEDEVGSAETLEERGNPYWVNENMAVVCISSSSEDEAAGTARSFLPAPPPPVDLCVEIDVSSSEEGDDELYDRKVKLSVDVEREDGSQPLCTECARVQPTLMRADGTHLCVACAPWWLRSTAAETAQSCCVCRHARVSPSWIKQPVGSGLVCMHCACMTSALLRRRECACGATSDAAEDGRAHVALTDDGEAGQWVCDSCVDAVPRPPGPGCLECGRTSSKGWVPDPLRVLRGQPWGPDRLCMECLPEAVQSAVCCYRTLLRQRLPDAKKPMSIALMGRYRFYAAKGKEAAAQLARRGRRKVQGRISQKLSEMWNKLSESERQEWIARARKDRERQVALRESSPGSGSGSHGSGPSDVAQGAAKKLPFDHAGDAAVACPGCGERAASTLATRTKHLKPLCEACVRAWVEIVCGGLVCSQCSARVDWDKVNKEAINPGDGRVVCIGCAPGTGRAKRQCRLQQPSWMKLLHPQQQPAAWQRARTEDAGDGLPGCTCSEVRAEDIGAGKAGKAFMRWKKRNPNTWLAQHADCLWEAMLLTDCMPPTRLQVERVPGKGWGVVAREDIPRDSFVMDFGAVVMPEGRDHKHEARVSHRRNIHENKFEIWSSDVSQKLLLVPTRYGNAARLMNHACADGTIDSATQKPCPRAVKKLKRLAEELGIDGENKRADPNKIPEGGIVPPYTYLSAADHIDDLRPIGTGSVVPDLDKLREDGRAPGCRAALRKINQEDKVVFFTVRDVPEGAELVYDYKMTINGQSQHDVGKKRCKCGTAGCRQRIM
ncbi:unnamed protein product [Pedinophyceae sp. YPF-701]|nr:unnamed protein product [Pedinophyceae sp. YPF-701]